MRKQTKYKLIGNEWLKIDLNYFLPLYYKNWKHKKQDLDNLFKALLDFLWDNIEWFEDSNIKIINAEKHDSNLNEVKILIKELCINKK
jgi:Holliday junction resolvase RusA-like endonuclease